MLKLKFEWDPNKATENKHKHRIAFERAAEVFVHDPNRTIDADPFEYEERWQTIGFTKNRTRLLFVVYTSVENGIEIIRIISAQHPVKGNAMAIVSYFSDEIPSATEEEIAELKAEQPDSEIDLSDMPEWDEFDFKYSMSASIWNVLTPSERTELARKLRLAKEAERAAKKAQHEVEQATTEARTLAHQT